MNFGLFLYFIKITSYELQNFINLIVFPYILTQRHIHIVYLRAFTFLPFLSSPQPCWNFGISTNKDKFRMMKLRYIQGLSLSFLSWTLKSAGLKLNNKSDNFLFPSFPLFLSFFLKVKLETSKNQNYVIVLHFLLYIPSIFLSLPSFPLYSFPLHFSPCLSFLLFFLYFFPITFISFFPYLFPHLLFRFASYSFLIFLSFLPSIYVQNRIIKEVNNKWNGRNSDENLHLGSEEDNMGRCGMQNCNFVLEEYWCDLE